jgi:hypothetical protein
MFQCQAGLPDGFTKVALAKINCLRENVGTFSKCLQKKVTSYLVSVYKKNWAYVVKAQKWLWPISEMSPNT